MVDIITNDVSEVDGYHIQEPIGEDVRYHIIFSQRFGEQGGGDEDPDLHAFL